MRTAILFGATGLVGGRCLERLLTSPTYTRVVVVGRRSLGRSHPRLEEVVVPLDALGTVAERLKADDVFIALGTTIKKAGSQEAFRKVDYDYVLEAARVTTGQGAQRLALVSSLGADPRSLIFYNRVKGEIEEALKALPFSKGEGGALHILRPSVLLGERSEHRAGEKLAAAVLRGVGKAMVGPLEKYRGIEADAVAAAMVRLCGEGRVGVHVYESDAVAALGALG